MPILFEAGSRLVCRDLVLQNQFHAAGAAAILMIRYPVTLDSEQCQSYAAREPGTNASAAARPTNRE
jgi:hypothetical protein